MIREEVRRLTDWGDHHHRLLARLIIAFALTLVVDAVGATFSWIFEHDAKGTEIHSFGDAVFFATVQLLTVSSQLKNPITAAGRVVDVGLEMWALFVVTAVAGAFAAFFTAVRG